MQIFHYDLMQSRGYKMNFSCKISKILPSLNKIWQKISESKFENCKFSHLYTTAEQFRNIYRLLQQPLLELGNGPGGRHS